MTAYYDLGQYSRPVSTKSSDAQAWFDRGLIWCYGYNHDEAVRCFRKAAEYDPACAMAHWGVSYAAGPNYNKQWKAFDPADLKRSRRPGARKRIGVGRDARHGGRARYAVKSRQYRFAAGDMVGEPCIPRTIPPLEGSVLPSTTPG